MQEYSFINDEIKNRAEKAYMRIVTGYISDDNECVSIVLRDDGYEVNDRIKREDYKALSQSEALDKLMQILDRYEEEYRSRPSSAEYYEQMMQKLNPPAPLRLMYDIDEGQRQWVERIIKEYDGFDGRTSICWLETDEKENLEATVLSIIAWRNDVKVLHDRRGWLDKEDSRRFFSKWFSIIYAYRTIILSEKLPDISEDLKNKCIEAEIAFGKPLENGFHDFITGKDMVLDYCTYAGSVDDAATYVYWSWGCS